MSETSPYADSRSQPTTSMPRATPLRRHSLYEAVTERLREMVLEGELAPGSRISEKQLCESFEVSPTPLRQAFKVLANEGLLELLPNRGAKVTEVDPQEIADLFEVMTVLEGLSGKLLATRASDAEIAEIRTLHERMMEHYRHNQRKEYFHVNQTIHRRLSEIAGNRVLIELETSLTLKITRARYAANMQLGRWDESTKEHEQLLEALERRDAQVLSEAMSLHMRMTGNAILQGLSEASPER